jgi:hypothetical protein
LKRTAAQDPQPTLDARQKFVYLRKLILQRGRLAKQPEDRYAHSFETALALAQPVLQDFPRFVLLDAALPR